MLGGAYLKVDGPVPSGVKGVEEEVRVGGGIWGWQRECWGPARGNPTGFWQRSPPIQHFGNPRPPEAEGE